MNSFLEYLTVDPHFKRNYSNRPIILGGFVLRLIYSFQGMVDNIDNFYKLFYKNSNNRFPTESNISTSDILLPIWFRSKIINGSTKLDITFYVPLEYTSNKPSAFGIYAIDPSIDDSYDIVNLIPVFLSIANKAQGTDDLPFNQGRFNHGWNSITVTVPSEIKINFLQIQEFERFNSFSIKNRVIWENKDYLDQLTKNDVLIQLENNTASRHTVISKLNVPIRINKKGTLMMYQGRFNFMTSQRKVINSTEIVYKHDKIALDI